MPRKGPLHYGLASVLVSTVLVMMLSGCTSAASSGPNPTDRPIRTNHPIRTDGPISAEGFQPETVIMDPKPGQFNEDGQIVLQNTSNQTVYLDRIYIQPYPGVSPIGISGTYIVGPDRDVYSGENQRWGVREQPVKDYPVTPMRKLPRDESPPLLVLSVGPGKDNPSYNRNVQVYYHTKDGSRFVIPFPLRYLICVKGDDTRKCLHTQLP